MKEKTSQNQELTTEKDEYPTKKQEKDRKTSKYLKELVKKVKKEKIQVTLRRNEEGNIQLSREQNEQFSDKKPLAKTIPDSIGTPRSTPKVKIAGEVKGEHLPKLKRDKYTIKTSPDKIKRGSKGTIISYFNKSKLKSNLEDLGTPISLTANPTNLQNKTPLIATQSNTRGRQIHVKTEEDSLGNQEKRRELDMDQPVGSVEAKSPNSEQDPGIKIPLPIETGIV